MTTITLDAIQQAAVQQAMDHPVSIITGGPGTGKTTIILELLRCLLADPAATALCAPTGKAARRIGEQVPGYETYTIHRLLGFYPAERKNKYRGFTYNRDNHLPVELLVVDETSMMDTELGAALFDALRPGTRVVLVGDADQLPPVGPGNVLGDLILSKCIPTVFLENIYRQGEGSGICSNAARICRGEMPEFSEDSVDFFFHPAATASDAADVVEKLMIRIEGASGTCHCGLEIDRHGESENHAPVPMVDYSPKDIQVLSPQHNLDCGTDALNTRLQALLNPPAPYSREWTVGSGDGKRVLREGDRVMHCRNNYKLDVFNGETGEVVSIVGDRSAARLSVAYDDRTVEYTRAQARELFLCYACTVHKSQGSEYPVVIVVVHSSHSYMLGRTLLYTAVTRGKRLVYLVGNRKGLRRAVRNTAANQRYTGLQERLQEAMG